MGVTMKVEMAYRQNQTADYVRDLAKELAEMAAAARLNSLAFILQMAVMEATELCERQALKSA